MPGFPLESPGQIELAQFANQVSAQTGVDPRVLVAWGTQESGQQAIGHNWLNLRPYPGDPYSGISSGGFEEYASVQDAAAATVRRIKQPFAAPIEKAAASHATPAAEIAAIAATGWDAGHYGGAGGPNLQRTFASIYGSQALGQPAPAGATVSGRPGTSSVGSSILPGVGSALSTIGGDIVAPFTFAQRAYRFVTSWRFVEVVGGFLLLLVGLYLLGRQFGLSVPAPPGPAGTVAKGASELQAAKLQTQVERTKEVRSRRRRNLEISRETRAQREARETRAYYRGAADAGR